MSKFLLNTLFAATAASLNLASFGTAQAAEPASIEITAKPLRAVMPHEADEVVGTYQMSDGRRMSLRRRPGSIDADLDGEPVTRLRAVNTATGWQLRSQDGHMEMRFAPSGNDDVQNVTVTLVRGLGPATTLASVNKR